MIEGWMGKSRPRGSSAANFCSGRDDLPDRPGWGPRGSGGPGGRLWRLLGGSWGLVWTCFGRMFVGGENQKMVRKCFRTHQQIPKKFGAVEKDMADQIFGVPKPGGAQNGRK